ncbi:MAG: Gfo/Idh/MocA family oxidoreductase [Clostridia bacterium]|nr:Gfo/Idh/MocA family oxidoreductase [Clostridia bacterium]
MAKLKMAVIGTGGISNEHIRGYINNPDTELYAFCDINAERVKMMAEQYGVPLERTFTDKDEMLRALPEIDAVSVCTWNSAHAECTIAALNAGKHVICEKPMAMNAEEAKQMLEAAKRNNKLLMIGFVRRHGNDCEVIRENVDAGTFGELYYAKATYLRRNGNPGGWFGDKSRSGGGPLIDLGVHVIDLVRFIFGNPKPVSVYGVTFQKLFNRPNVYGGKAWQAASTGTQDVCDVEDLACALIRFDNGAVLSVEAAFSLNIKKDEGNIELFGTKAGAKLDPNVEIFTELNNRMVNIGFAQDTALSFDGLFQKEIDNYIDAILGKAECLAPAEDGVEMMKILDAVYESARTGHEVVLN